jgi:flagellar M-ring protein FliF
MNTEYFSKIGTQISEFIKGLSTAKKAGLFLTAGIVLVSLFMITMWTGDTAYQTLYSNLTSEDATAIMRLLREKKIPFRVDQDGKVIKIPPEAVYDLRLELAASGYPQSSVVGYEVFDKTSFSTTSFVQKLNQKRAIEGELMRTINQLKGVVRSRVHLAMPAKSAFIEDQKRPTASVVIDIEPGQRLNDKQISGISHLIASAVEGMEIGDVTIVDANGKVLSKNTSDPLAKQTATMIEFQQKMEQDYERRIEEILSKITGEGKVVAKVSLDIDFTQMSETQTIYDQEGAAIRAQQKESTLMDGSRPLPTGPPGATSNVPGPQPANARPEVRSNTQKSFETSNYAVPETVRRSIKPTYAVKKVSVAVLVDNEYIERKARDEAARAPAAEGTEAPTEQALAQRIWESEKKKIETLVSSAVGYDKNRNDTIDIQSMSFTKADLEESEKQIREAEMRRLYRHIVEYGVVGLLMVLFFLFVVRPFIRWLTDNTVESMESFLPKTVEELEKLREGEDGLAPIEEALPVIVDKVDPEKVEGEMIKEKVVTLIEKNPAKAAMIIHEWISEPSIVQKSEQAKKTV